ncbi:YraN family protein [Candidatus Peregrinibacteria bacterium]|nr:YraN family protein [Candidatus Peregrinibacteria bacterium]
MTQKHLTGKIGEDIATSFLRSQGYEILDRNFRFGHKEIDLIVEKDEWLVFVEVKMRRTLDFGYGEESVTGEKRKHLLSAAAEYLKNRGHNTSREWRFDIVAIELGKKGAVKNIEHMQDVFF